MGRKSLYTPELGARICELIAHGNSLVSICKPADMPDYSTVARWINSNEPFREMYVRAREDQADFLADEIVQIADDGQNDTYVDAKGKTRTDWDVIGRSKLRVDARKWIAAKLRPRKWGESTRHEVSGPEGGAVPVEWRTLVKSAAEREKQKG